jgi:hypothetical protein
MAPVQPRGKIAVKATSNALPKNVRFIEPTAIAIKWRLETKTFARERRGDSPPPGV